MMKIEKFEDTVSWQKARVLNNAIHQQSKAGALARDTDLRAQFRRAATCIMANIAERFERGGGRESLQFLAIAKGSCGEVRALLSIALDQGYILEPDFQALRLMTIDISRLLSGFMAYLGASPLRGHKYKPQPSPSDARP